MRRSATAAAAAAPTVIGSIERLVRAGPHSCCISDLMSAADLALRGRPDISVQWPVSGGPHAPGSAPPPANIEFCRGRIWSARCVGWIVWNMADGSKQLFTLNLENDVRCCNTNRCKGSYYSVASTNWIERGNVRLVFFVFGCPPKINPLGILGKYVAQ